jgi:hypothetical protein
MHVVSLCRVATVVLLAVSCCRCARGQESLPPALRVAGQNISLQRAPGNSAMPATKKRQLNPNETQACVLLKNDNVLFGQARQLGEFVIVTTAGGGEVRLPRLNVACWAENIRELYQYRIDQRGKPTLRSHLRDARWCVRYDLYDLAARELIAVQRIDPDNREANALERQLRNLVAPRSVSKPSATRIGSGNTTRSVDEVTAVANATYEAEDSQTRDIDPFTIRRFASHIQPMLLNRCSVCHQTMVRSVNNELPKTQWRLTVPSVGSRASASITRSNLQAAISCINQESPENSPLLTMATTAHGGSQAALSQRNTKAIQSLKHWVKLAAASLENGQSINEKKRDGSAGNNQEQDRSNELGVSTLERALEHSEGQFASESAVPSGQDVVEHGVKSAPHRLPPVSNPFDPDLFNRRFHAAKSD